MKRKLTSFALTALLILAPLTQTACTPKTTTQKLAIYTAQADAALIALTDAVFALSTAGKTSAQNARSIYQFNLRMAGAIDVLRDRAETGFNKQEALTIIQGLLADLKKAQDAGVINLSGDALAKFNEVIFFAQFTLNSIQAIIQATKEPPVPAESIRSAALGHARAQAAQDTTWTELVLILQTAVLRGIAQSRMTAAEAFADGRNLSAELKASLNAKIGS